jgi:hypothetical protein
MREQSAVFGVRRDDSSSGGFGDVIVVVVATSFEGGYHSGFGSKASSLSGDVVNEMEEWWEEDLIDKNPSSGRQRGS